MSLRSMLRGLTLSSVLAFSWTLPIDAAAKTFAVVGGGPAGMNLSQKLRSKGHHVILLERASYVGGNIQHGYYIDKRYGTDLARLQQYTNEHLHFFGRVRIGEGFDLSLGELSKLPLDALLFMAGAGVRPLGLPPQQERLVIPYSRLFNYWGGHEDVTSPPSIQPRSTIVIIGNGSGSHDTKKFLLSRNLGFRIIELNRRGPGESSEKHMGHFLNVEPRLDKAKYAADLRAQRARFAAVGQDVETYIKRYAGHDYGEGTPFRYGQDSGTLEMRYLLSPVEVLTDEAGEVKGLRAEHNRLIRGENGTAFEGTGVYEEIRADAVIAATGGIADDSLGLPILGGRVVTVDRRDDRIKRDKDVRDPSAYFEGMTLEQYQVDFSGTPLVPPFFVGVGGWNRLPGIGASEETDAFSNMPEGRNLGRLLHEASEHWPDRGDYRAAIDEITRLLESKGKTAVREILAPGWQDTGREFFRFAQTPPAKRQLL